MYSSFRHNERHINGIQAQSRLCIYKHQNLIYTISILYVFIWKWQHDLKTTTCTTAAATAWLCCHRKRFEKIRVLTVQSATLYKCSHTSHRISTSSGKQASPICTPIETASRLDPLQPSHDVHILCSCRLKHGDNPRQMFSPKNFNFLKTLDTKNTFSIVWRKMMSYRFQSANMYSAILWKEAK